MYYEGIFGSGLIGWYWNYNESKEFLLFLFECVIDWLVGKWVIVELYWYFGFLVFKFVLEFKVMGFL